MPEFYDLDEQAQRARDHINRQASRFMPSPVLLTVTDQTMRASNGWVLCDLEGRTVRVLVPGNWDTSAGVVLLAFPPNSPGELYVAFGAFGSESGDNSIYIPRLVAPRYSDENGNQINGTVTSVALTMPAEFSVGGSPITSSGTLAVTKGNQSANEVYAGPSSGGATAPAFRSLVSDDLPTVPISKGGTGQTGQTAAFDALAPTTTKGDVIVFDGSDNVRVAVGNDYEVIVAESGQSSGVDYVPATLRQFAQTADVTVADTVTETTLTGSGQGTLTLPADRLTVGASIRIIAAGYYSTTNPSGTLELRVKLGGTTILDTTADSQGDSLTNQGWRVEGLLTCRSTGASGTLHGQGLATMTTDQTTALIEQMQRTSTATIDTTGTLAVDLTAEWGTADAGNTITCTNLLVEVIG